MKKVLTKSISLFVCVLLVVTMIPLSAFADSGIVSSTFLRSYKDGYRDVLTWDKIQYDGAEPDYYNIYESNDSQNYSIIDTTYSNSYYLDFEKGSRNFYVTAVYFYFNNDGIYTKLESPASNVVNVISYNSESIWCYGYYEKKCNIKLFWDDFGDDYDGYKIFAKKAGSDYRFVANVPVKSNGYNEYSYDCYVPDEPDKYYFVIVTYSVINSVEYYNFDESNAQCVEINMSAPTLVTKTKSEQIKWKKYSGFDSYEIWQSFKGNEKCVAIVGGDVSSYTVKGVDNYKNDYSYYIKAMRNGECITTSYTAYSDDGQARFRGAKKLKKKKNSVKVINTRTKKNKTAWTSSLSSKDKKTLQKFAKKHFKKGWSNMQKAQYTLEWINKNVNYAKGKDYNKIAKCTYVDAIFNKKAGQCLQYNGAYAMMLTYLGYEARIVQGWRGTPKRKWSHYWCEMKIDGKWYLMETGNFEDSGNWMHFCQTYRNAGGYMLNGKVAK